MKTNNETKDNNFLLSSSENYKTDFECDIREIIDKYAQLIIEYSKFIKDSIKVRNKNFAKFIIIRGLDTITNVFQYMLYFTRNLDLTYYHCQKSFYFYIEFVSQITEDDKMFLQLTTRDATMYVYKKTIYDLNHDFKNITTGDFREKIGIITNYIKLYQTYLMKIIQTNDITNIQNNIKYLENLREKLNKNEMYETAKINFIQEISEQLYYKIEDIDQFFEIIELVIKKILKKQELLKKSETLNTILDKINLDIFNEKIQESSNKFVSWLVG